MAQKVYYPTKDSTIYSDYNDMTSGGDPVLDLNVQPSSVFPSGSSISRILISFDSASIINDIMNISGSFQLMFSLYNCDAANLPEGLYVEIHPVYQTWTEGVGYYDTENYSTNGVTWLYAQNGVYWITSGYPSGVTGSYISSNPGGGCWYTASVTCSLSNSADIDVDITPFFFLTGITSYDGFIIKLPDFFERNNNLNMVLNYFSRNSNTIYYPRLNILWNDSVYYTGSLSGLDEDFYLSFVHKQYYTTDEVAKIRVYARNKYPKPNYTNTNLYTSYSALPSTSYFGVVDVYTGVEFIQPYTQYNILSCDSISNYFYMSMSNFIPGRYYNFFVKVLISGSVQTIYDTNPFKVVEDKKIVNYA